jgi:hypothetical protein
MEFQLEVADLEKLEPGIFRSGTGLIVHPWFNDALILYNEKGELYPEKENKGKAYGMGYMYAKVNWVAVRGTIHDWCIYHSLDSNFEPANYIDGNDHLLATNDQIRRSGAKLMQKDKIKEFVPCTEEAFELYRF